MKKARIIYALLVFSFFALSSNAQVKNLGLSFNTKVKYGKQENNLKVMVSTDFSGDFTKEAIQSATWTDITNKFKYAEGEEPLGSGEGKIGNVSGKKVYIAFKYLGYPSGTPTQRGWMVSDIMVNKSGEKISIPMSKIMLVNFKDNHENAEWFKSTKTEMIVFRSNQSVKKSESWAIFSVDL